MTYELGHVAVANLLDRAFTRRRQKPAPTDLSIASREKLSFVPGFG
jgi:hypothetical protein